MGRFTFTGLWRGPLSAWPVFLALVAGLVLTASVAMKVQDTEQMVVQARFNQEARSRIVLVREIFRAQLRELQGLRRFVSLQPGLTQDEFQVLARLSDRLKMTLAWNSYVPASEFEAYLARMRQLQGPGFNIVNPVSEESVTAENPARHYPISFFKSNETGIDLRGLDTGVLPSRVSAYQRALASGKPTMVTTVKTLDDPDNQSGILVFAPVYTSARVPPEADRVVNNLRGFVGLGLRLSNLGEVVASMSSPAEDLTLSFTDISQPDRPEELLAAHVLKHQSVHAYSEEMNLADRVLKVTAYATDPAAWAPRRAALAVWVVGLLGSMLVAGYIALILRQRSQANRLVDERTRELQESHAYLASLLASANDVAIVATDGNGQITLFNAGAEQMLGYNAADIVGNYSLPVLFQREELDDIRERLASEPDPLADGFAVLVKLAEEGKLRSGRWNLKCADGSSRPAQSTLSPIRNNTGDTIGYVAVALDMMRYEETLAALRRSDDLLQNLSSEVPGAIFQYVQRLDGSHYFPYVSGGIEEVFEITREAALRDGQKAFKRARPADRDDIISSINRSRDELTRWSQEFRVRLPSRGERWLRGDATPSRLDNGSTIWHGYISDITTMKELEFQLREQATVDPLTGTFNRRHLESHWLREMARFRRNDKPFAMIMLDIDHFKDVNDAHGHDVGDQVLVQLGHLLRHQVRSTDVVYRLGGEEFLVVCEDAGLDGATILAEALSNEVRQLDMPFPGKLTASFGVIEVKLDEAMDMAFKRLDRLLYIGKDNGRDQVVSKA